MNPRFSKKVNVVFNEFVHIEVVLKCDGRVNEFITLHTI